MRDELSEIFVVDLPPSLRESCTNRTSLEAALRAALDAVGRAVPALRVPKAQFIRFLAARVRDPVLESLARLQHADLYLACGCLHGQSEAIQLFEANHLPELERVLERLGMDAARAADIKQTLWARLLLPPKEGATPKLAQYRGTGRLAAWVGVAAAREALMLLRGERRLRCSADLKEAMLAAPSTPELSFFKQHYQGAFLAVFPNALAQLEARERNLLRQRYLYGLGIQEIAALHQANRNTIGRWLERARSTLLAHTRRLLLARLRISDSELDSIMRLIYSQLDISIERLFTEQARSDALASATAVAADPARREP